MQNIHENAISAWRKMKFELSSHSPDTIINTLSQLPADFESSIMLFYMPFSLSEINNKILKLTEVFE